MPETSTRSYPLGTHVMSTNGSGYCTFTPASTNEIWEYNRINVATLWLKDNQGQLRKIVVTPAGLLTLSTTGGP